MAVKPILKTVAIMKPELTPLMLLTQWATEPSSSSSWESGFGATFMSRKSPSRSQHFGDCSKIPITGYGYVSLLCAWTPTSIHFLSPDHMSDNWCWEDKGVLPRFRVLPRMAPPRTTARFVYL